MKRLYSRLLGLGFLFFQLIIFTHGTYSAEPTVQIRSPKNGAHIAQEQYHVLVSGKASIQAAGAGYVDIFLVLDVSGSTAQNAGVDFSEFYKLPNIYVSSKRLGGRGLECSGARHRGTHNLRDSILAAEVIASRRLLAQLNPQRTRVGVITFGEEVWLRQPLTHDFEKVRSTLEFIYRHGPYGGTNMVDAIRLATQELSGKGESEKYLDSIKSIFFFTDGFPTRPIGDCTSADTDSAIDAARLAGRAGLNVHVFALGEFALSNQRAAVGIAETSGGTFTPVMRPADVVAVVNKVSAVGITSIHVTNETIQEKALLSRLAADGFFASAVPVVEGLNRLRVLVRASDGSVGRDTISVHFQPEGQRSLDLEVFLEKERSLKLEVERLGKSPHQIQKDGLRKSPNPTPPAAVNRSAAERIARPELIEFKSGNLVLKGFVWKPSGKHPFPALLWNHGGEKSPGSVDRVAPYFVSKGYVFFVPHRRGQGRSPGPYIIDEINQADDWRRSAVDLHETHFEDQLAALQYLKNLPYVDKHRIAVMGASFGGIQTLLAVERGPGYRAAVNCSGAAASWRGSSSLRSRLTTAARKATMPVFFLQAENDYDLTPNRILSEEVRKSGKPVEAKVYPAFGSGAQEGHSFCWRGAETWGPEVLRFIEAHIK